MKPSLLTWLMRADAAVLLLLGLLLMFLPHQIEAAFKFNDLPAGVSYMLGLWGCVLATLGLGYAVASIHPLQNLIWVEMGIARGVLESLFGLVCLGRGIVTMEQAGVGILVAMVMTIAYVICYPRRRGSAAAQPA